jgi:glycosyltransferase involved in cell wall biosynthesis
MAVRIAMPGLSFSIVTPSFNMASYLESTIESVLSNMRTGDEYFIIDGGSTDESVKIIKSYEKELTGWVSEPDRGYADALAKGFNLASGDILCWINTGDLILKGAFDKVREILTDSDADFIYGDDFYISEDNKIIFHSNGKVSNMRDAMCYGDWTPLQDACFWRKDLYKKVGGINPNLKYAADFDLFLRFAVAGKTQYSPYTFSAFRRHENQKSISGGREYKEEKKRSQKSIQHECDDTWLKQILKKIYYWLYVRIRVRFIQKAIRNDKYNGLDISEVQA